MKKLLLSTLIIFCNTLIYSQTDTSKAPEITFEKLKWEFGTVPYAGAFNQQFVFKNTGKSPLIITEATTSCGCDVASATKEPIMPGKTGVIRYTYDTKRVGKFTKTCSIISNAKSPQVVLTISGEVSPPPKDVEKVDPK